MTQQPKQSCQRTFRGPKCFPEGILVKGKLKIMTHWKFVVFDLGTSISLVTIFSNNRVILQKL